VGFIIGFTYFYSLKGYVLGAVLGFVITLFYLVYALRSHILKKNKLNINTKNELVNQIRNLSKFNFLGQVSDQLRIYTGFFIANYFILDRELFGQYSFALILIQGLGVISSSVQQFILPKLAKLSANKQLLFEELRSFEKKYMMVAFFIFLIAQLIIPFVVDIIFSGKYNEAMPFFRVLLFGWLIYSAFTLKGAAFIGLGRLDLSFRISFYVLISIIPLLITSCYYFGVWGVVVGYVFQNILNYFISNKYIKSVKKGRLG